MKKMLSAFLSLLMIISLFNIPLSAQAYPADIIDDDGYINDYLGYSDSYGDWQGLCYYPEDVIWDENGEYEIAPCYPFSGNTLGTKMWGIVQYLGNDDNIDIPYDLYDENGDYHKISYIGPYAFANYDITTVNFDWSNVKTIGSYAFMDCEKLEEVYLSNSLVRRIGSFAFSSCVSLEDIEFPSSLKRIEDNAFYNTSISYFYIPSGVTYINGSAFDTRFIPFISVSSNNNYYSSYNYSLYNKSRTKLIYYSGGSFPKSLASIGSFAFGSIDDSVWLDIPKSVTSMKEYAFAFVKSKERGVNIQGKVKTIPANCFFSSEIKTLRLPNTVTKIGEGAFSYATCTDFSIPNSVKTIGEEAFYKYTNKGYSMLTVPASVTKIGKNAFKGVKRIAVYKNSAAYKYARKNNVNYYIAPKKGKIKRISSPKKGTVRIKFEKVSNAKGYQIQVSDISTMTTAGGGDKTTISGNKKFTYESKKYTSSKKFKSNKVYYARVRAYTTKTIGGKKYKVYGSWSGVSKIKIK